MSGPGPVGIQVKDWHWISIWFICFLTYSYLHASLSSWVMLSPYVFVVFDVHFSNFSPRKCGANLGWNGLFLGNTEMTDDGLFWPKLPVPLIGIQGTHLRRIVD